MPRSSISILSPPPPPLHWQRRVGPSATLVQFFPVQRVSRAPLGAFWQRCTAFTIDTMVFGITTGILYGSSLLSLWLDLQAEDFSEAEIGREVLEGAAVVCVLMWLGYWLYETIMTSSPWGATFGKRALGIRIVRSDGSPLGSGRAALRFLVKSLIAPFVPFGIGYLSAAFTLHRRALHDVIADTMVIREE